MSNIKKKNTIVNENKLKNYDYLTTDIRVNYVGEDDYYGFMLDGNCRYVMGDFTVTHNTCTSIAIAEGMKTDKKIYIMTPASLKMNFFSELKKCGDHLFKKNQFWEFVSIVGQPDYLNVLSNALSLDKDFIKNHHGAWLVNINKPANFTELSTTDQKSIDTQLNEMIRSKYIDINYNGLNMNKINELTQNSTINPFDNSVVIIDEAHNFVSRIVNKIDRKKTISNILYEHLMNATNTKIVLLTGTPIINYPNEIGVLYNILRGYIKTWTFPLNIKTNQKINRDAILEMFDKENFRTYDYVEYSGNNLIITRNPFGFINTQKRTYTRNANPKKGGAKTKKIIVKNQKQNKTRKNNNKDTMITVETTNSIHKDIPTNKDTDEIQLEMRKVNNNMVVPGLDELPYVGGDGDDVFDKYNGVKLDDSGNVSDSDFMKTVIRILKKYDIDVAEGAITIVNNKPLPDDKDSFLNIFVDKDSISIKNANLFKKRILGLTSYFRSAQEKLLPQFVKTDDGNIFHIVECEFSEYQFTEYAAVRHEEAEQEKNNAKNAKRMKNADDLFEISGTFRIFSRAYCNFVFPQPPGRPMPTVKQNKEIDENEFDASPDEENQGENLGENLGENTDENLGENPDKINTTYSIKIQQALKFLQDNAAEYLLPDGLKTYSPKFLQILENIQNKENVGLHLLYSQFRTIEGIGILKLILEANGFVQLKVQKKLGGEWEMIIPEDITKPRFLLYTGTETPEEKEILRNIYNSQWEFVPISITNELKKIADNNFYGEIVKLMMITSSGAEGINLRNTRFVHIVEPYWHMVRIEQVIGRARRICSHQDLPEELRTVKVFLYLSTLSEQQSTGEKNKELVIRDVSKLDKKTPFTTDEMLYEISRIKDNINQQLLKAVKESAIDCSLYSTDSNENLVCYGYGKVESNQFGSYPSLKQDEELKDDLNVKKQKLKLVKATIDGVDYAVNKDTNEVYDMASYVRSKTTGENLIYIGKIIRQGKKNIIDTRQI